MKAFWKKERDRKEGPAKSRNEGGTGLMELFSWTLGYYQSTSIWLHNWDRFPFCAWDLIISYWHVEWQLGRLIQDRGWHWLLCNPGGLVNLPQPSRSCFFFHPLLYPCLLQLQYFLAVASGHDDQWLCAFNQPLSIPYAPAFLVCIFTIVMQESYERNKKKCIQIWRWV